jgi:hypothetical protein
MDANNAPGHTHSRTTIRDFFSSPPNNSRRATLAARVRHACDLLGVVVVVMAIATLMLAVPGCASGLEDNQANQTNSFGGQRAVALQIPGADGKATPVAEVFEEFNSDGEIHRRTTKPIVRPQFDVTIFDGPLGKNAVRWTADALETYHEGHTYAAETPMGYAVSSTPIDSVDVDMGGRGRGENSDGASSDGLAATVRGIFSGDFEVRDTDGDGWPDELKATKSDVVSASGQVLAALTDQRKAMLQVVGAVEGQRIEAIRDIQLAAIEELGGSFTAAMGAIQALARPGVAVELDDRRAPELPNPDEVDALTPPEAELDDGGG